MNTIQFYRADIIMVNKDTIEISAGYAEQIANKWTIYTDDNIYTADEVDVTPNSVIFKVTGRN